MDRHCLMIRSVISHIAFEFQSAENNSTSVRFTKEKVIECMLVVGISNFLLLEPSAVSAEKWIYERFYIKETVNYRDMFVNNFLFGLLFNYAGNFQNIRLSIIE